MTRARITMCALLLGAACNGKSKGDHATTPTPPPSSGGSDLVLAAPAPAPTPPPETPPTPAPSPVPPVAPPLPTVDAALLANAKTLEPDKRHAVNATAVGPEVTAMLVQKLTAGRGEVRPFRLLLVLSGKSTLAVDLGALGDVMGEQAGAAPDGTLLAIAANLDLTATADDGGLPALKTRSPLLYRTQFHIPGASDDFAITQEGDALVVWYFSRDEGAKPARTWTKRATIALAKGAKVTAK